ncbi:MAG: uracil-DNA glycosylase, partial [Candidatus Fermentibacterota bacterium]
MLAGRIRSCAACGLSETRRNALPGEGDPDARVLLIALSPGRVEDREGRMFLGPSGDVLDRLLDHAGVRRSRVYMTNLVKCTLPKNRRPRAREIEACAPWLEREINVVGPKVLVPLGFYSSRYVMST